MIKFTQLTIIFMVGALLQGFGSIFGAAQQNKGINSSLSAQSEENKKNRQYNLLLAQKQNEWNIQQWERANEYNNPLNQMTRLKQAGLNPNLVYGNGAGQSVAVPNPQLTSGAPSTPQDMSLIAQRPTVGQVITNILNNESIRAQIDKVKADTRKTLADAGISETQLEYEDAKQLIGLDLMRQTYDKNSKEWQILSQELEQAKMSTENMKIDVLMKKVDNILYEKKSNAILKKLENDANLSETNAKLAAKSLIYQLIGLKSQANIQAYESQFKLVLDDDNFLRDIISVIRLIKDSK